MVWLFLLLHSVSIRNDPDQINKALKISILGCVFETQSFIGQAYWNRFSVKWLFKISFNKMCQEPRAAMQTCKM